MKRRDQRMKKKIFSILLLAVVLASLIGCEKELMSYEGKDCLYFDVRRGQAWIAEKSWAHYNFTEVAFGNMATNDTTLTLKVGATGDIKDYDRPFAVVVNPDSTTAEANVEYEGLLSEYVIKAGETSADVKIKVKKTDRMNGDTVKIQLTIQPNQYFDLMFDDFGDSPGHYAPIVNKKFDGNHNAAVHNVFVNDVLTKPAGWYGSATGGLFGQFSAKKYRYIMEVTGTDITAFKDGNTMSFARAQAVSQKVAKQLLDAAMKETPVLDEDGSMMWVSYVNILGGTRGWSQFTKPEEYYNK